MIARLLRISIAMVLLAFPVGAAAPDDDATEEYLNAGDALKDISAEEMDADSIVRRRPDAFCR